MDNTCLEEKKCPLCGKKFVPAPQHALRDARGFYCKPTCFLHRDELHVRKRKKVRMYKGEEFVKEFNSATAAAHHFNTNPKCIGTACRQGTTYRGYTFKYEE